MGADSPDTWDGSGDNYIDGEGIGMIKPIEPRCLALLSPATCKTLPGGVVNAHAVTVISRAFMRHYYFECECCGAIDNAWNINSPKLPAGDTASVCECLLTRIDGHDPDAITETDKEKEKCE